MAIITTKIQFRRDTAENWAAVADVVIPLAGEPCFETDTGVFKIGDGVKYYGELPAIGGAGTVAVAADGNSIVLENDTFKLAGFDAASANAQPRKNADGKLEWFIPVDTSDVVDALKDRVEALEAKMDGSAEGSVEAKIIAKINEFATQVSDDKIVNSYKELIDYVAEHGGEAAEMAAKIAELEILIEELSQSAGGNGEENVIEVIKLGDEVLEVVDKTVVIPVGAGFKLSDEFEVEEDGTVSIKTISFDKLGSDDEDNTIVMDGGGAAN